MNSPRETLPEGLFFLRTLVQSYAVGSVAGAVVLQVMIAVINPGEDGAWADLAYPTFIIFIPLVGLFALVPFLANGLAGWQFRHLLLARPVTYVVASVVFGGLTGLATSMLFGLEILPGGVISGPIVGAIFGLVWCLLLKFALEKRRGA